MLMTEKELHPSPAAGAPGLLRLIAPEIGEVIDGRFLILELLKEGGTSRVFKATDLEVGDLVALKLPKEHFAQDQDFLSRFRREEEIGLSVRHPSLVAMRPVSGKSRPYLAMEFLRGETLATRLATGPKLSVPEAMRITAMVLDGLEALHRRGIVHRDVTPQNILLCEDGTVRLMDYGIAADARSLQHDPSSEEWTWGTPAYMAPEQVRNERTDARTDLYSLGIVLYELLTGSVPFTGDDPVEVMNARLSEVPVSPRTLNPDLAPNLERILLRAIARERGDRFRSARAMKAMLEPFLREWMDRPTRRRRQWQGWSKEHWAEIAASLVGVTLLVRICTSILSA